MINIEKPLIEMLRALIASLHRLIDECVRFKAVCGEMSH